MMLISEIVSGYDVRLLLSIPSARVGLSSSEVRSVPAYLDGQGDAKVGQLVNREGVGCTCWMGGEIVFLQRRQMFDYPQIGSSDRGGENARWPNS